MQAIHNLIQAYRDLRRFHRLPLKDRDFVFYSEFPGQWIYFEPFIRELTETHQRKVCYLCSSLRDPVLQTDNPRLMSFFVGSGTMRTTLFRAIRANLMIMTLLDLDKLHLKRSKHPVHYVYLPHNMTSTHMVFRKGAHDAFDSIFCVGPHQVRELREAEALYGLPERTLAENGYVRLDAIRAEAAGRPPPHADNGLTVLIAPSWGAQGLFETGSEALIDSLLDNGHRVVLRPHRETYHRAGEVLKRLRLQYAGQGSLTWAEGRPTNEVFLEAHILVTDWSGSGLSFAFGTERPVLFIDLPQKVNNPDFNRFKSEPLEVRARQHLGMVLAHDKMAQAAQAVEKLWRTRGEITRKIRDMQNECVFNLDNSASKGAEALIQLADAHRAEMTRS